MWYDWTQGQDLSLSTYNFFSQGFEPMIQAAESGLPVDMSQVVYNAFVYINIYMNNCNIETCKYLIP